MERRGAPIEPKYSKLFIMAGKSVTEDDLRESFSIFGNIESAIVKIDRNTGKSKGLCYVKYYLASAAAEALEEMNGAKLGSEPRGIKILLASENPVQNKDNRECELPTRVFIRVPTTISQGEIKDEFKEYGRIVNINHIKAKGLAFITYDKFVDAAKSVEGCPAKYKAAFAEPKPAHPAANQDYSDGGHGGGGMMGSMDGMHGSNGGGGMGYGRDMGGYGMDGGMDGGMGASFNQPQQGNMNQQQFNTNLSSSMINMIQQNSAVGNSSSCRLKVKFNPAMSKETFMALFNIVPGLVNCDLLDLTNDGAIGVVIYNNAQSAAYAAERLNNLGVPAGSKLQVVVDEVQGQGGPPDKVADLVNTIQQATQALKEVGYGGLVNEASGSVVRGGATMMGGASRGGGTVGGMMGGGMGMGGMGGGMGGNTMMDNGMIGGGSIPSLMSMESSGNMGGSRSMGGRGDVRSRLGGGGGGGKDAQDVCSVNLPGRAKMLPASTPRLISLWFLLPDLDKLPDPEIVTDAFCRFGNLIDATCLRGKKCGYANYGSEQSASAAISTLNGCQFLGSRFRVEVADETRSKRKRQKTE